MENTLNLLAHKYCTDKSAAEHNYCPIYERHLASRRFDRLKLLELGIKAGASLRMWRDYFVNATIMGIDVDGSCAFSEARIITLIGSQDDVEFITGVHEQFGPFDVIIDDASHIWDKTITTMETLLPLVVSGGYYVVEDTQCSYWVEAYGGSSETTIHRLHRLVDQLTNKQHFDDDGTPPTILQSMHFYPNICFLERA